jgi:hypothetical protein
MELMQQSRPESVSETSLSAAANLLFLLATSNSWTCHQIYAQ